MAKTFLDLCRDLERESGTVSPSSAIPTVVGQRERRAKIVNWVAEAWNQIQLSRTDWLFMRKEYTDKATVASQGRYEPGDWSLTNHNIWLPDSPRYRPHTIRDTTATVRDDSELAQIEWEAWRRDYGRGQAEGRPLVYAISPAGEMCLGPVPDDVYAVSGEYVRGVQALEANDDVPDMPAAYHSAITWKALTLLGGHDESVDTVARGQRNYIDIVTALIRAQTSPLTVNQTWGALA